MDAELSFERRAARHAALGDPARLRIVDALSLGDRSPTELQDMLVMQSNLLAHHLKLLEGEGMIVRTRSEADRRRSYVSLVPDAFDGLTPAAAATAHRVLFVCTANSARSQLAVALWAGRSAIPATSAGTHPADRIAAGAVAAAHRNGFRLPSAKPRSLAEVLTDEDFVVTVCDTAHELVGDLGGIHWSVPDPVREGTDAAFDRALEDLARRIDHLAPRLIAA